MHSSESFQPHPETIPSDLERVLDGDRLPPRYGTGLVALDDCTGGLAAGELWVITAAVGQGRSTLLSQLAVHMATRHEVTTWVISNRDSVDTVAARAHSLVGRVSLRHCQEHRATSDDEHRLAAARQRLVDAPLHLISAPYASHLMENDPRLTSDSGPVAACFDDPTWQPGWELQQARALADTGAVVVVTLPRPMVLPGDAYACDLEPAMTLADVVLEVRLSNVASAGVARPDEPTLAAIAVLRNRRGPIWATAVAFHGHHARFLDWLHPQAGPGSDPALRW